MTIGELGSLEQGLAQTITTVKMVAKTCIVDIFFLGLPSSLPRSCRDTGQFAVLLNYATQQDEQTALTAAIELEDQMQKVRKRRSLH